MLQTLPAENENLFNQNRFYLSWSQKITNPEFEMEDLNQYVRGWNDPFTKFVLILYYYKFCNAGLSRKNL